MNDFKECDRRCLLVKSASKTLENTRFFRSTFGRRTPRQRFPRWTWPPGCAQTEYRFAAGATALASAALSKLGPAASSPLTNFCVRSKEKLVVMATAFLPPPTLGAPTTN